jgi:hypothetical protein
VSTSTDQIRREARSLQWTADRVLDQAERLFEQSARISKQSREMLAYADELDTEERDLEEVSQLAGNVVSIRGRR